MSDEVEYNRQVGLNGLSLAVKTSPFGSRNPGHPATAAPAFAAPNATNMGGLGGGLSHPSMNATARVIPNDIPWAHRMAAVSVPPHQSQPNIKHRLLAADPPPPKKFKPNMKTGDTNTSSSTGKKPAEVNQSPNDDDDDDDDIETIARFDLCSLQPVKRKVRPSKNPPQIIELVEHATKQPVVCFRGITDTCRALNLDRELVKQACASYKDSRSYDFGTYTLRYATPAGKIAVYEWGAHPLDLTLKPAPETYAERLARFQRVHRQESRAGNTSAAALAAAGPSPPSVEAQAPKDKTQEKTNLAPTEATTAQPVDHRNDLDVIMKCIVCQKQDANIVFEPCRHCVLCTDCSKTCCSKFCPLCRLPIHWRSHGEAIQLVQPRIYSAYSFM